MYKEKIKQHGFNLLASSIKTLTNINVFEDKRTIETVIARSVLINVIKALYPKTTHQSISLCFLKKKKLFDRATVTNSIKRFEAYANPRLGFSLKDQKKYLNGHTVKDLANSFLDPLETRRRELKDQIDKMSLEELNALMLNPFT